MDLNFSKYSPDYLKTVRDNLINNADGNGGIKDGRITLQESYNNLNVGSLFSDLKEGSFEYNRLNYHASKIPAALQKYAGDDGIFQASEYADFINGEEWKNVLDAYHSSSNFCKTEMDWIDSSDGMYNDGNLAKGELKVGILRSLSNSNTKLDTTLIEDMVDEYAGDDGTFTVEEYTALKNNNLYKNFIDKYNVSPFN